MAREFERARRARRSSELWKLIGQANRYIDQTQPWAMAKDAGTPQLGHTLWCLQRSLWTIAQLIAPVLPATSTAMLGWLGDTAPAAVAGVGAGGRVFPTAPARGATADAERPVPAARRADAGEDCGAAVARRS